MKHSNLVQCFSYIFLLIPTSSVYSQNITLPNAYAHNDYWHKRPLQDALTNGFTYVEVDIYLRNNKLIVAHILPCFQKKRTLEALYLKPLIEYTEANNKRIHRLNDYHITLMIDIKTDAKKTYRALLLLLQKYKSILSGYENGQLNLRTVTVVITGNKPLELINARGNHFAFMDENLQQAGKDSSLFVYPIASCKYSRLLQWKGRGALPDKERRNLEFYVNRAHQCGRKVRLWASPENTTVWSELLKCKVDLINTDNIIALRNFLISATLFVARKE